MNFKIRQVIVDAPYLLNRLYTSLSTREGFLFFIKKILGSLYVLVMILYILSPLDLIPDSIPIIGLLDDAIVLIHLVLYVSVLYYNFLRGQA